MCCLVYAVGGFYLVVHLLFFTKVLVEETGQLLESLNGISVVHAQFYELSSSYYKVGKLTECKVAFCVCHDTCIL